MNTIRLFLTTILVALLGNPMQAKAEDIDIYSGLGSTVNTPNVLIVMDNAADFSSNAAGSTCVINGTATALSGTVGGIEQCALYNVINGLPTNADGSARINIGMMVYNANNIRDVNNANCGGSSGGCLAQPLIPMDAAHKTAFLNWIQSWVTTGGAGNGYIKASGEATAATMQEAWAYYKGATGLSGRSYAGIQPASGCQKNFVIFIGNSYSASGTPSDAPNSAATALSGAPNVTTAQTTLILNTVNTNYTSSLGFACGPGSYTFPSSAHETKGFYADEWARYMQQSDLYATPDGVQSITTYTVGILGSACQESYAATLTNMARYGGGKYFPTTDYNGLVVAILKILNEVQAVNSVFSSSSLPVSVNAQGTFLNQIYMGMFRPDPNGNPRWVGNLKQYQFIPDPASTPTNLILQLGDSVGKAALNSAGTGFLAPDAISFWTCTDTALNPYPAAILTAAQQALLTTNNQHCTDPSPSGFWVNDPSSASATAKGFDLPDGERVERGGTAQQIRQINLTDDYTATPGSSTNPRKLYTWCPSGSSCNNALTNTANVFDTSNAALTDALLGTGPSTITSITSAATVQASGTLPGASGAAVTVSITALSKSSSTVTATVSATDLAKLAVGSQLKIATLKMQYDCNPCTVATINTGANTFTYLKSGGSGTPTLPYTATVYTNFVTVTSNNHGLAVGQTLTLSACTTYTALNSTIDTVTAVTTNTFTLATTVSVIGATSDSGCKYTSNTATVTTSAAHNFSNGNAITIAGAGGTTTAPYTGFNGTWTIAVTGTNPPNTFTYQYTAVAPLTNFSGAGATATSTITRDSLTKWVRGDDNQGDEAGPGGTVNVRPSVHGDVLHSRPTVVNYGGSTGVVVFYGDNGGVFHAVNGNQATAIGAVGPGDEMWGFIPKEFFLKLKRLMANSPQLNFPSTPPGISPQPQGKDYFIDGTTGLYQLIDGNGNTTKAVLYLAMRRGGRFIYALDVTNPATPTVLWKVDNTTANMSELGQTWSQPKVARVAGYANPVLIFGAGYDTNEDSEPITTADASGRGIFVLDALTGALVWSASSGGTTSCSAGITPPCHTAVLGMNYSIPADITLVDRDSDGFIDRLYATDTGGNIWRVDLEPAGNATPDNWSVHQLAALGCFTSACAIPSNPTQRKFFYPPEVITTTAYDAVIAGSGDREHPLYISTSTQRYNRVFLLKDTYTGNNAAGMAVPITMAGALSLFDATSTPWDGSLNGYYITLAAGEKVVNAPLVTAGFVNFGTNQPTAPSANSCTSNLGIAKGYQLSPFTGTYGSIVFTGGGLPPSPVSGVVSIVTASGTKLVPFLIGGGNPSCVGSDCSSALGGQKPQISVPTNRTRTYWYQN